MVGSSFSFINNFDSTISVGTNSLNDMDYEFDDVIYERGGSTKFTEYGESNYLWISARNENRNVSLRNISRNILFYEHSFASIIQAINTANILRFISKQENHTNIFVNDLKKNLGISNTNNEERMVDKTEMKNLGKDLTMRGIMNFRTLGEYYVMDTLLKSVKQKYGEEILIYEGNSVYNVTKWIADHDKKFDARPKFNKKDTLSDCQFIFKLDTDTYCFVQSGDYVYKFDILSSNNSETTVCLKLYIFGKKYKKYAKDLYDIINNRTNNQTLYHYNVKGGTDRDGDLRISSVAKYLPEREIDTLFLNNGYKNEILDHINAFLENRSLYEAKNLIYKTGILLYGEPGTGKSSLALALANHYNRNLVTIDMGTFDKLDIPTLTMALNANPTEEFIVLLEDIDTLFSTLDREDKSIDKDERAVINKMLQFLDSTSSPNNVIFIATTNHIEKLDDAILRDGRFDIKINISNINLHTAAKMCNSFNIKDEDEIKTIIDTCKLYGESGEDKRVNPAELQNKILKFIKEKNLK